MSFGWFAHGWNVSSGAVLALWSWCCADENVCNAGALLGFEVTSHVVCCSQVPGMRVVVRRFCLVASSGIGLLFENCIVDASIFEFI